MMRKIANILILILIGLFLTSNNFLSGYSIKSTDIEDLKKANNPDQLVDEDFREFTQTIEVPADDFIGLSEKDKKYLIDISYQAVNDYFNDKVESRDISFDEKFNNINNKVFIGFRINGRKKGSYSAQKNNLAESVYEATLRTVEDQRYDGGITKNILKDLKIEIIILGDEKELDSKYEKGIHGLRIDKGNNGATYYNTVAIEGNHNLDRLLEKLCEKAGLDQNCSADSSINIYYFPTIHFATTRFSDNITTYYRCNTIDLRPDLDRKKIEDSLDSAKGWLFSNFNFYGYFNYEYYPSNGSYSNNNNMIRQLMSSKILAEEVKEHEDLINWNNANRMHKKNLDFIFKNWYREDGDLGYIYFGDKSKIGAMALALRVLISSPYFENYSDIAEKLANTLIEMQNEDGSFNAWYIEPDYNYDEDKLLNYYSGQAILSLVELYEKTGNKNYLEAAILSQDYYIEEYIERMEENYFPAYVPWHTMALYKLYINTDSEYYKDAVFKLNDEIIKIQNQDGEPYIDYLGRFYDPDHSEYGAPFSGSTAVYTEGLTYAYELAVLDNDENRIKVYKRSILLGIHNLINLQFGGCNMYYLSHPERVNGAIRYRVDDNIIRIDTTQHTIDALTRARDVLK